MQGSGLEEEMKKIILTGDRPTGKLHVGHYVGSLKRRVELQNSGEYDDIYIMIADAQALTDNADNPEKVRKTFRKLLWIICPVDLTRRNRTSSFSRMSPNLQNLLLLQQLSYSFKIETKSYGQIRNSDAWL